MRRHRDAVILILIAATAMTVTILTLLGVSLGPVGTILGAALVLICPGVALMAAACGGRVVGGPEGVLLSIGLSLVAAILGGLALHSSGISLHAGWWSLLLATVTLGASLVALAEQWRNAASNQVRGGSWPAPHTLAMWVIAGGIITAAIWIAIRPAPPEVFEGYTQLWIQPAREESTAAVVLGIRSMELTPVTYTLQLRVGGSTIRDLGPLVLEPGQTWEETVTLPVSGSEATDVVAALYRLDDVSRVYRWVMLRSDTKG